MDPAIDRDHLHRQTLGDVVLAKEVLGLFAEQARRIAGELKAAEDSETFKATAHYLKGSARAIGAQRIAAVAAELELNHWQFQTPQVRRAVDVLEAHVEEAIAEIGRMAVPF